MKATRTYFEMIKNIVVEDIRTIQKLHTFSEISVVEMSLGCVHASMIADAFPKFRNITLILPGHCLAEPLWYGIRTQHLKQDFEMQGVTLLQLKKEWQALAPENNIRNMEKATIQVQLSQSDTVIPYIFRKKLVDKMREEGLSPLVKENKFLGHYGTAIRFFISNRKFNF